MFLGLLGTLLPWHRVASLDAWRARRRGAPLPERVPAWTVWAVRTQLGLVYVFGGLAKLQPDWLLHAQPLKLWLGANTDFPLVGAYFDHPAVALRHELGGRGAGSVAAMAAARPPHAALRRQRGSDLSPDDARACSPSGCSPGS